MHAKELLLKSLDKTLADHRKLLVLLHCAAGNDGLVRACQQEFCSLLHEP